MRKKTARNGGFVHALCTGAVLCIMLGCGVYTFSGSTLPSHLKSVKIPLFLNESLQPGVAEYMTEELTKKVQESNLLKPVLENADATIEGKVVSYSNQPYYYNVSAPRDVNVVSYAVQIGVDIALYDNVKDKTIFRGTISKEGVYQFGTQSEDDGRRDAVRKIIEEFIQNSVQNW